VVSSFQVSQLKVYAYIKHFILFCYKLKKKTPQSYSANELYLPSDRRLSAKLVPIFRIEGATW
jgi:hypothetical protein